MRNSDPAASVPSSVKEQTVPGAAPALRVAGDSGELQPLARGQRTVSASVATVNWPDLQPWQPPARMGEGLGDHSSEGPKRAVPPSQRATLGWVLRLPEPPVTIHHPHGAKGRA